MTLTAEQLERIRVFAQTGDLMTDARGWVLLLLSEHADLTACAADMARASAELQAQLRQYRVALEAERASSKDGGARIAELERERDRLRTALYMANNAQQDAVTELAKARDDAALLKQVATAATSAGMVERVLSDAAAERNKSKP